jgi:RHS repeat-associated protein
MTVPGQPPVSYTYDNANRLLQMTQGSSNVNFTYDDGNRRSSLTLPNGVNVSYTYDSNSQVTGIAYNSGVNTLGGLSYSYDQAGHRISVGGSFGRTGLPQPVVSTSYDAANEVLNWNGSSMSYDANGNMLSDGTHTFTWDARNHLVTIDNGATASFVYDAFGRRASKTISGATTAFLFDRFNVVQETTGANVANSLTGGVDEVFQRSDAAGPMSFLTDALGSTVALTDSTGVSQAQYSYDPFGNTSPGGAGSTNSFAYTGRELDAAGLYFYRARYYNPSLQRFISEDPAQLQGGSSNFYAYAADAPTQFKDPSGKCLPTAAAGAAIGLGLNGLYNLAHRKNFFTNGWTAAGLGAAAGCGIGLLADLFGAGAAAAETSVFWSGGPEAQAAATAWAEANGGITLGMTEAGQATELATQGLDWAIAKPMWAATSADFASAASGDVVAFINAAGYSSESIFATVELGGLLSNPAVTSITIIVF